MMKEKEFTYIQMISLIIFVFVLNLINSVSFKVLALNEEPITTLQYENELVNENNNAMLPGSNMTFGSSLDNAKMHLMEAIMDIENNNINGALMQLNMTTKDIKMHEQEMADMMLMMNKMKEVDKK
jgi:RNA recognition motif-containing protein